MVRLAADENLNQAIVRGLLRRNPAIDIVRVQDVGLAATPDPIVLQWCADEKRILLTHDVSTITKYAYERTQANQAMPGVFEISRNVPLSLAIEDILLIAEGSEEGEWEG